jgi:hypothetical protein
VSDAFSDPATVPPRHRLRRRGVRAVGLFPLYFHLLAPSGAWEILTHRILWTLALCAGAAGPARPRLAAVGVPHPPDARRGHDRRPAHRGNWVIYVAAVVSPTTSPRRRLGYFLNPLVTVAIGVVVLRERLRRLQWAAVAVGLVGGIYLTVTSAGPRGSPSGWPSRSPSTADEEAARSPAWTPCTASPPRPPCSPRSPGGAGLARAERRHDVPRARAGAPAAAGLVRHRDRRPLLLFAAAAAGCPW